MLSYAISSPRINNVGDSGFDDTYTGWCNDELCYGGKGQLMDGIIGKQVTVLGVISGISGIYRY